MKIDAMHVTPIAVADPPLLNAAGLHAPYALRLIVEIVTADHVSGFGEVPGHYKTEAALQRACQVVTGRNPFALNQILLDVEQSLSETEEGRGDQPWDSRQFVHVRSALEVALLDLQGKLTGRPVHELLGGKVRDRVEYSAYLFYKLEGAGGAWGMGKDPQATGWAAARQEAALDPDGVVAQAQAMCEAFGFQSIKLKGGAYPRRRKPRPFWLCGRPLGLIPPSAWIPMPSGQSRRHWKWADSWKACWNTLKTPYAARQTWLQSAGNCPCPWPPTCARPPLPTFRGSVAAHSEDVILSDHHFWGGLRPSLELAAFCRAFGRGLSMHSNSHVGISLAAMTHLGAVMPNLSYACDTHYPWQTEEILTQGPLCL